MIKVTVTRPERTDLVREFEDRREAAKFGVAYYLRDNGYATAREATAAASQFQRTGRAEHGGYIFQGE